MGFIEISDLCAGYSKDRQCIDHMGLSVEKGEILVILGHSGCGKSTLLKVVSGLMRQSEGTVTIDGQEQGRTPPEKRPVSMVFQKALLFRNMTVAKNVNYAPRLLSTLKGEELKAETDRMLKLVDLEGYGDKKANELSGGQEQRVSLARALITKPKVLLLDEPFSALDAELRVSMRKSVREICKSLGQTVIFVTHDQEEAIAVGDRIALMEDGRIVQCSEPTEFYTRPNTKSVASFFGWKNFVPCVCAGGRVTSCLGEMEIPYDHDDGEATLTVRPEAFEECADGTIEAKVTSLQFMGSRMDYQVDVGGNELYIALDTNILHKVGETIRLKVAGRGVWVV